MLGPEGGQPAGGAVSLAGKQVLVVDDEEDILETVKMTIEAFLEGVEVHTANGGAKGLEVLGRQRIDMVLTDYKMPGMNGMEFLKQAREIAPRVPRVIITAYPDMELAIRALNEEKITSFLQKPLQRKQVVDVVSRILSAPDDRAERERALLEAMRARRSDPGAD